MIGMLEILATLLLGWLLADLISGVVHWAEDRFGHADWPVLGALVIAPNRHHHAQPLAFTRGQGFLRRNSTNIAASLIGGGLLWVIFGPSLLLAVLVFAGCIANQVHFWAHCPERAPAPVRLLQRLGLLQSRRQHGLHHLPPHRRCYCILSDWLNPTLDAARFWQIIEASIPRRWFA